MPVARRGAATIGPERPATDATSLAGAHAGVEWLIDNAEAHDRLLRAMQRARRSIWMTQLAFDADFAAYPREEGGHPSPSLRSHGETLLAETLVTRATSVPVDVRILLNATLLIDTSRALGRFFDARMAAAGTPAGRIRVRGVRRFPQLMHAKMVIVDGAEAFLLGSPFANGYWDDVRHLPVDERRPARELGGRPLHDVSMRIAGIAVQTLARIFLEQREGVAPPRKEAGDGARRHPRAATSVEQQKHATLRIVCTAPRGVLRRSPRGATDILDALLAGIERARSLIYVEHQYLSARPVVAALTSALSRQRDLELVVVLNQNPDVTAYRRWQNARLAEHGLLAHPRVGVFSLWNAAPCGQRAGVTLVNQVFVHSKVVAIDDCWATVGSANIDGVSLHSYGDDFAGPVARRLFRDVRNFDVNAVVSDTADGLNTGVVANLRLRLWSEHLDLPAAALATRPIGGWLSLWRARAGANLAVLIARAGSSSTRAQMRGFVLPYSVRSTPVLQLADLGLRVDGTRLDVRFNPGWLETHFSPNWVRNMFL